MSDEERAPPKGYTYHVSTEQLRVFARLSYEQRFAWLESTRAFLVAAATPETIERVRRLRRGETVVEPHAGSPPTS
ncbi:MAG: hypothetical protein KC668_16125 [Myxococcales bacterium]|nr:hypothetical protein [Myxococcales bacterium]